MAEGKISVLVAAPHENVDAQVVAGLKRLTLLAADAYNASYKPGDGESFGTHTMNHTEAAESVARFIGYPVELAPLVGLALSGWWNDVLDWAGDHEGRVSELSEL